MSPKPPDKWAAVAVELGTTKEAAKSAYHRRRRESRLAEEMRKPAEREAVSEVTHSDDGTMTARAQVRTLDDLLDSCEIDRDAYAVQAAEVTGYQVTVKAPRWDEARATLEGLEGGAVTLDDAMARLRESLEPRTIQMFRAFARLKPNADENKIRSLAAECLEQIAIASKARSWSPSPQNPDGHLLELGLYDAHLGKQAWAPEAGEDYDLKIACRMYREAAADLIEQATRIAPIERSLYVVGHDFFHFDNMESATTHGTRVDSDSRWHKVFSRGRGVAVETIERLAELSPVDVVIIPGNHDTLSAWSLGYVLEAWFRGHPSVTVDVSPTPRKYYRWHKVGIGMTHGNHEVPARMEALFAVEAPDIWAATTWREMHVGHVHSRHHKRAMRAQTSGHALHEGVGVIMRTLPSLSAFDFWHKKCAWVGSLRGAEAMIWGHDQLRFSVHHIPRIDS